MVSAHRLCERQNGLPYLTAVWITLGKPHDLVLSICKNSYIWYKTILWLSSQNLPSSSLVSPSDFNGSSRPLEQKSASCPRHLRSPQLPCPQFYLYLLQTPYADILAKLHNSVILGQHQGTTLSSRKFGMFLISSGDHWHSGTLILDIHSFPLVTSTEYVPNQYLPN